MSELGEPFENFIILGFLRWRVAQQPNVRREDLSSFFRDILASALDLRLVLESDVMKQVALARGEPGFRHNGAGSQRGAEVAIGQWPSSIADDSVNDFLVLEHGDVRTRGSQARVDHRF